MISVPSSAHPGVITDAVLDNLGLDGNGSFFDRKDLAAHVSVREVGVGRFIHVEDISRFHLI